MAITAFDNAADDALDALQSALLAENTDWDADDYAVENSMILALLYTLVATIKARQHAAPSTRTGLGRDRLLELVGGHTANAMMHFVLKCDEVYNELYTLFGDADAQAIMNAANGGSGYDVFPAGFGTLGPKGGPIHGSPNYTAGLSQ